MLDSGNRVSGDGVGSGECSGKVVAELTLYAFTVVPCQVTAWSC